MDSNLFEKPDSMLSDEEMTLLQNSFLGIKAYLTVTP